jgi:hypothetical protein
MRRREHRPVVAHERQRIDAHRIPNLRQHRPQLAPRGGVKLPRRELQEGAIDEVVVRAKPREAPTLRRRVVVEHPRHPRHRGLPPTRVVLGKALGESAPRERPRPREGQQGHGQHGHAETRSEPHPAAPRAIQASARSRRPKASTPRAPQRLDGVRPGRDHPRAPPRPCVPTPPRPSPRVGCGALRTMALAPASSPEAATKDANASAGSAPRGAMARSAASCSAPCGTRAARTPCPSSRATARSPTSLSRASRGSRGHPQHRRRSPRRQGPNERRHRPRPPWSRAQTRAVAGPPPHRWAPTGARGNAPTYARGAPR